MKYIRTRFILSAMLAFPFAGLGAQEVAQNDGDSLTAKDPQVQVAFRKVAQSDLLGGVSVVNVEEMQKKDYTTYSLDNMSAYAAGWNGNSLWGMDGDNDGGYLVLVDGVPRDANNVLPSEIAQITFLKGASAVVLYGSRAAKGAIYITTKRGEVSDLRINVRANTGFHVAKSYPEYLGAAEYMTLYNEAFLNDGGAASQLPYSADQIYNTGLGTNPYRYPDVNFYSSDYIRKAYNRSDVTAEFNGGNRRARFYANINYYRTGDVFKFGEAKDNNINRLSIRGNVDLTINDFITAFVNANTTFYNSRSAKGDYWDVASTFRPNRISPLIPLDYLDPNAQAALKAAGASSNIIDGKYFLSGTTIDRTNIFADYYAAGYNKYTSRQFQFDTGVNIDLNKLLKGLSFQTQFAVDYATSYNTSFDNTYAIYMPTWSTYNGKEVIVGLEKDGVDKKSGVQNVGGSSDRQTILFSGQFNYVRTFADVHHVSAMLIANGYQRTQSEEYHRKSNTNLGVQLGYNYGNKYYADFGMAVVHSAKLAEGHRQALSPSLTLGWRLSKESFLADSPVVDDLMLSVSGSILHTDLDISDYYMYSNNFTQGGWFSWNDGNGYKATYPVHGDNEELGFIKRKEISVNLRTSLWKKMITADASFFINSMEGLLIEPSTLFPNYFSSYYPEASFVPYVNFNNNRRMGFDFNVNFNKRLGAVDFSAGVTGTYYTTKATQRDENNEYAYQNREGRPLDGIWGLKSDGLFQSQAEIDKAPVQKFGSTVRPGDIKYVDQNGDNVIDNKDVVYLGKGGWYGSPFSMGVNLTAKWNNFTLFVLGTGSFGSYAMKNNSYWWVHGDGKYSAAVRDRWTPETAATATYPRLTTESGSNNFQNSDFWMYKTNAFHLAKVQLTYDLPQSVLRNSFIHGVSAYISGTDLLTIAKERELLEMSVGSAPKTRFYNLGVKLTF